MGSDCFCISAYRSKFDAKIEKVGTVRDHIVYPHFSHLLFAC